MFYSPARSDQYSSEANLRSTSAMPVKSKSWRRTKSDLLLKEGEEQPSGTSSSETSPSKPDMTPLKWKSSPVKDRNGSADMENGDNMYQHVDKADFNPPFKEAESSVLELVDEISQPENSELEIDFQPVDLDQKYREQAELMKRMEQEDLLRCLSGQPPQKSNLVPTADCPETDSRKHATGQDAAAMTIEFLRARLLSERSASKAANQRVQQLAKKVVELEQKLGTEMDMRRQAELSLMQALDKLKGAGTGDDHDEPPELEETPTNKVCGLQGEDFAVVQTTLESSCREVEEKMLEETSGSDLDGTTGDNGMKPSRDETAIAKHLLCSSDATGGVISGLTSAKSSHSTEHLKRRHEMRSAIEERLRAMWDKISEEMAALAEVKSQEEMERLELVASAAQTPNPSQSKESDSLDVNGELVHDQSAYFRQENEAFTEQTSIASSVTIHADVLCSEASQVTLDQFPPSATDLGTGVVDGEGATLFHTSTNEALWSDGKNANMDMRYKSQEHLQRDWKGNHDSYETLAMDHDLLRRVNHGSRHGSEEGLDNTEGPIQSSSKKSRDLNYEQASCQLQGMGKSFKPFERNGIVIHTLNADGEKIEESDGMASENIVYRQKLQMEGYGQQQLAKGAHDSFSVLVNERVSRGSRFDMAYSDPVRAGIVLEGLTRTKEVLMGPVDSTADVRRQGWPVREILERASNDVYHTPTTNVNVRLESTYSHSEQDQRSKILTERLVEETLYRDGMRWESQLTDPRWQQGQIDREASDPRYRTAGRDLGLGVPSGYPERAHVLQEFSYPLQEAGVPQSYIHRSRIEGNRGITSWQESGEIPGVRNTLMTEERFQYPASYHSTDSRASKYVGSTGLTTQRELIYPQHMIQNSRISYSAQPASLGVKANGYIQSDAFNHADGYTVWDVNPPGENKKIAKVRPETGVGEPGEVLRALNMAKQQIKRSTGEQGTILSTQYTVSSEHRYGLGIAPSKQGYSVESPMPYTKKTVDGRWQLDSSIPRKGGFYGFF